MPFVDVTGAVNGHGLRRVGRSHVGLSGRSYSRILLSLTMQQRLWRTVHLLIEVHIDCRVITEDEPSRPSKPLARPSKAVLVDASLILRLPIQNNISCQAVRPNSEF